MSGNLFTPAKTGRASEDIALQIESAILNKSLRPGDRLPSERELQSQFATGRGVIREAIQTLKQKGLIEIQKGPKGGALIKQVDVSNISESLALFLKQKDVGPDKVAEFRESVDQTVAQLAMVRGTEEQKDQLLKLMESLEEIGYSEPVDSHLLGETDRQLNLILAEMSHNPIFSWVMHALQQGFGSNDNHLYDEISLRRDTIANWRATVTYLINQEPMKLQASISRHYLLLHDCSTSKAAF